MGTVGHGQQGEHRAVVGQGVQAAGRDGSNSVQYLGADSYAGALFQEGGGKRF